MPTIFLSIRKTGVDSEKCRITELSFLDDDKQYSFDEFIKIPSSIPYPEEIQNNDDISRELLDLLGQPESTVAHVLHGTLSQPETIVVCCNIQQNINFVNSMFERNNLEMPNGVQYLDMLTLVRDWIPTEHHRLNDLTNFFKINVNSIQKSKHEVIALRLAFIEMFKYLNGKCNIEKYINKVGYLPYFGEPVDKIDGVTYYPQNPKSGVKVYDKL